jgi:hypothetical protein
VLTLPSSVRIYVAAEPVDLRCGFDGLAAATRRLIEQSPLSGHVFVFLNRRRNRIKLLVWDRTGYLLLYNQPSSHYTSFDSRRGLWSSLREARCAAARSQSRSQRLQCFAGWVAGSS